MRHRHLLAVAATLALISTATTRPAISSAAGSTGHSSLSLSGLSLVHALASSQDGAPAAKVLGVEAWCQDPTQPCNDKAHLYNAAGARVEALNYAGVADGTPFVGDFVCIKGYRYSDGTTHLQATEVLPGDRVTFSGRMYILNGATETATSALGGLHIQAYDFNTNDYMKIDGDTDANNVTDRADPGSGGYTMNVRGTIYDADSHGNILGTSQGVMQCVIPPDRPVIVQNSVFHAPPHWENVISDTDGDY